MADRPQILICSCEDTMPLDADAVKRGCRGAQVTTAHHLCRAEIDHFRAIAAAGSEPIIVGCTQEAPLFSEVAGEQTKPPELTFVNVRETAGWAGQGGEVGGWCDEGPEGRRKGACRGRAALGAGAGFLAGELVERGRHAGLRARRA